MQIKNKRNFGTIQTYKITGKGDCAVNLKLLQKGVLPGTVSTHLKVHQK